MAAELVEAPELAAGAELAARRRRPIDRVSEVIEVCAGQHAAELVEGVGPVEARVDERGDGLHALFAQRHEARVRGELLGLRLGLLRLRR